MFMMIVMIVMRRCAAPVVLVVAAMLAAPGTAAAKLIDPAPADHAADFVLRYGRVPDGAVRITPTPVGSQRIRSGGLGLVCREARPAPHADTCIGATGTWAETLRLGDHATPTIVSATTSIGTWKSERAWRHQAVEPEAEQVAVRGRRAYLTQLDRGLYLRWYESAHVDVSIDASAPLGQPSLTRRQILELAGSMHRVPVARLGPIPFAAGGGRDPVEGSNIEASWLVVTLDHEGEVCPGYWYAGLSMAECAPPPRSRQIDYAWNAGLWIVGLAGDDVHRIALRGEPVAPQRSARVYRDARGRGVFAIQVPAGMRVDEVVTTDRDGSVISACTPPNRLPGPLVPC